MHWLTLLMYTFLYALVGSMIGLAYTLLTGADMESFGNIVVYAGFAGPIVLVVIVAFRKLMRESDIPIARAIYHTTILTVAAPVLLYAAQLIAVAASAPKVARSFEVLKYWSAPLFFTVAVMYGIWRVIEGNRPRAISTRGRSGGALPPAGDSGSRSASASHRDAAGEPQIGAGQSHRVVACFDSRGTPFRLVRRPA